MSNSRHLSIAIGAIIAIVAVLAIGIASHFLVGAWQTAVVTVLSVVLSIGLISLIYEIWLRDAVAGELLAMVRLKESTAESGLSEIILKSHFDWGRIFLGCREFTLVPRDIPTFASREWPHILEAGRQRKIDVSVFLPSQAADSFRALESHLGAQEGTLNGAVEDARETMLKAWDSASKSQPPLRAGSTLTVYEYDDFPGLAVFATEETITLELDAALARQPGDQGCLLVFDGKKPSQHVSWASTQIERSRQPERIVDTREVK